VVAQHGDRDTEDRPDRESDQRGRPDVRVEHLRQPDSDREERHEPRDEAKEDGYQSTSPRDGAGDGIGDGLLRPPSAAVLFEDATERATDSGDEDGAGCSDHRQERPDEQGGQQGWQWHISDGDSALGTEPERGHHGVSGRSFLFPGFAVMSLLALAAFLLHPAGRSVVRFDRVASVDRRVTGLLVVAAVPLLAYAGVELSKQLGPVNEHVVFVHYGGMASAALYVVLMGALAIFRQRDWRFATWSADLIAAFVGLASIAYPASASSLGLVGGELSFCKERIPSFRRA